MSRSSWMVRALRGLLSSLLLGLSVVLVACGLAVLGAAGPAAAATAKTAAVSEEAETPTVADDVTQATVGIPMFAYQVRATGAPTPVLTASGLPAGLGLDPRTGIISGTPTTRGGYPVSVTATNSAGSATGTILIEVEEIPDYIAEYTSDAPHVGEPFGLEVSLSVPGAMVTDVEWFRRHEGDLQSTLVGTGWTYTPVPADYGATLSAGFFIASPPGDFWSSLGAGSAESAPVRARRFEIEAPVVTGQPVVGDLLTCNPVEGTPGRLSYRWTRDDGVELGSADTYVPAPRDVDAELTCTITSQRDDHESAAATSSPTSPVARARFTPTVSIDGVARVGKMLTCDSEGGEWPEFEWLRGADPVWSGRSYWPVAEDAGATLTCRVTASKAGYEPGVGTARVDVELGHTTVERPTIYGTAQVGSELVCDPTGYWHEAVLEWRRGTIVIATGRWYTPTPADVGEPLRCVMTVTYPGYVPATSYADTDPVESGTFEPGPPSLTGAAIVGGLLRCDAAGGPWNPSYRWLRGGSVVGTGELYRLAPQDLGAVMTCEVTATRDGYRDAVTTASSGVVGPGAPAVYELNVTGVPQVGQSLSAAIDAVPANASVSWQWLADGVPIAGARSDRFVPTTRQYGARLAVLATVAVRGYGPATSSATVAAKVALAPMRFSLARTRIKPGAKVSYSASNLLPGQPWLIRLSPGKVLARGVVGHSGTIRGSIEIPRKVGGKTHRIVRLETASPARSLGVAVTLR
ncbi:Ig domain-containing protein [Nocardioides sp. GXZ039]|uniref:Ig domain-containing protein n=1 Tax=Nocardioides sp. GXZ039 TaxID=3136018 RepID=UPI0030F44D74